MAVKVNTRSGYSGMSATGNKVKVNTRQGGLTNNGSAVGYLGARLGYGLAGLFEGFGDFVTGSIYQLAGDKEYAKYVYQNDIVGGWERALDRSYNPGKGMKVAGDIASGVGQALPSVAIGIATGGTSTAAQVIGGLAMGTAYAGQGVTRAVQTTGELGFKENAYGILSGAAEGATDMLLGGTVKAGKNLWTVAKGGTKSAAGKIARNGLLKNMWSSASSEFAEEFLQEYIDTGLLRLTGVDKNATTSLGNALYSGAIGFATGGLLGGATGSLNAVNNIRRGESVRQRGLESQLLGTANYIRNDYLGKNANFDKISSEALRTLSAAVDAYNKLENKNTTRGAMLLGEIQAGTYAFEVATGVAAYRQQIMANPTEGHAAYVSELLGKTVTVEDLRQNKDGVAETLAVTSFATGAFTESHVDRVANAVHDRVEQGRYMHAREGARWDGTLSEDGEMVFRAPDGRYMIVTSDAMEGGEGKYRVGFSETSEYDGEHIKVAGRSVTLADIKQGLAGLANGSLVIGENRLEPAQTRKNAPASGEGVVNGQVMARSANEAQRKANGGVSANEGSVRRDLPQEGVRVDPTSVTEEDVRTLLERAKQKVYKDRSYIPVRVNTPQVLIDSVNEYNTVFDMLGTIGGIPKVTDCPMAMPVYKARQAQANESNWDGKPQDKPHDLSVDKIIEIIEAMDDPEQIVYEKIVDPNTLEEKERYAEIVTTSSAGLAIAVVESSSHLNPDVINGYKGGEYNFTVTVYPSSGSDVQKVLNRDGNKVIYDKKRRDKSQRSAGRLGALAIERSPFANSIPQNPEMSTDSGKKVAENIEAVDGSRRSALPRTRARGDKTKTQAKAEKKAAERIAEEMRGENGRGAEDVAPYGGNAERAMPSRGYTDAEANTARGLVKDFDLMPPSVRRSIVELIRSGEKSGASKNFLRHSANLIAYWRRGLWIIADDKTRDDGFYTTFTDGSRLIVVKPNREAKAVSDTLMHELAHDVWARADAATRKVLYELATKGVKQEEIDAIRERYREELTKRGEIPENAGERSKVATTESESNGRSPHPSPAGATFPAGEGKEMTEAEVEALLDEEVATNLIGEIIGKEEFLGRFDGSETSTIKRILRTLSNMKKRFTGKDKYLFRKADDLFKAFTKVMALEEVQGASIERKRHALGGNNAKYDFTKPFYEQVKDWKAGVFPQRDSLMLGVTPEVFQKIGFNALPMTINQEHVDYALNGTKNAEHHIGEILLNYLPTALKNPVAIITSETQTSTSVVAILSITHNGEQIIAPVYIDGVGKQNGIRIDSNAVTSVHGRKNALTKLLQNAIADEASGKIGIFYWDKRRAIALLSGGKVTMPNVPNTLSDGFIHSIRENGSPVKPKLKNIMESQQFKRWFGDWQNQPDKASKVVNDDGSPRVLYHQTEADIEEFDTRHKGSGTNDDETPFGIFMKPTDQDIGLKGKKQMALYARIVNPLVVADRYEFVRQIKTMSPAYAELLKQRDALSVEYKQKIEDAAKKWSQYAKDYRDTHPDATRSAIYEDEEFRRLYDAEDDLTEEWVRKADELALKCKEEITQTLKKNGYDGVHLKRDEGSSGRSVETFIALDATQVKSATDNIGTFDGQDPHIRHALPKRVQPLSGDEMIASAMERGMGVKSQTSGKVEADAAKKAGTAKPKKTAAQVARENAERKAAAEMAQVEEKAARTVRRAQKSAENAVKNAETLAAQKIARTEEQAARRVRNAEKSAENAKKNADKKFAAEQARRDRESSETIKRSSREIARIDKNLDYLKNAVLHRSGTDGGTASAIIFEDPALRAVVKRLASRGTAYGLLHKSTREGMQDLLAWYTPENEILKGNAVDELLAASPQSVSNVFGAYNADIREKIERIANGEGDITAAELADLDIVVNAVARLYLTYGKVKWQGKRVSVEGLAFDDYREQMETRRALISGKEADGKPTVILKKIWNVIREGYLYSVVTPEVVLRDLENNRKGGVLSTLYRNIRLGEAEAGRIRAEILTPVATFFSEHKAYRRTLSTDRRIEFRGHQITAAQAVGLWETSKREQAQQRMFDEEKGGIRIAIYDEAEGRTVTRHVKVTSTDLDNLYNQFTEEDRGYIKALEESFKIASRYKVETDGEVWGYTNAIKGHYYPITTDENYFARDITDVRDLMSTVQVMNNKSFNKNTVQGAQAWLFIEDSLRVLERHAQGISAYSGLYIPLQTFGLVYGAKFDPTGTAQALREEGKDGGRVLAESVVQKTSLREYYNATLWNKEGATSTNLDKYLSKLFSDIQGITGERDMVDKVIAKIQSGYITATFGLNAKIILTQLASYGAAYKNLDADVLVQALARENSREAWREQGELMDKYSRITLARSFEGTGAAEGLVDQIGEVGRLATKGIDFTDRAVIVKLFMACQLQAEKNGVGEVGSEANLKEAGEMLDALLLDTQTTSLKSDASALMRSKNMVAKMVTMFRTESMKSFSNLYTSIGAYVNHKQFASAGLEGYSEMLEEDKKRIAKTSTSFLLSATWVAAVSVLFSRIRKAAKGEEEEEKLLAQGMREIGGNVIELFPVVSEIASYMLDGYELESIPVSVINQGLSTLKNTKVLFDAEASDAERARFLREAINTVGSFAGLPTRNAGRIALAATTIVSKRRAYEVNDAVKTNPTYQSDLDRALANGNDRLAETVLSAWFDRKKGGSPREAVSNEILRLYKLTDADGKSLLSLPKNVPASLNRKQSAAFSAVYAEADGQIAVLIASKAYGALDDAAKAKAIKAAYDMAWSRAAESLGLEDTGSAIKMVQASVDPSIMAAVAGFAKAYVGDGRKEKVIAYLKSLGLSKKEYNKYLAALGYKTV